MFEGSIVAIVTPMKDGELDERSLRGLLRMHLDSGTAGVVPAGCTGEAATLTDDERARLLDICLEEVDGRIPVIPGTGTNSTRDTIRLTAGARDAGAPAVLIITPYYNKPTPDGQYAHYRAVAEAVDIPIVLYNVPSRTGVNMLPETVARLSELQNIVAIKEAAGSVDQVAAIRSMCDITVLSGDDPLTLPMMSVGASGVVSVVANVAPALVSQMVSSFESDPRRAASLHMEVRRLSRALFLETNPGPVKHALGQLGLIESSELRLPLVPVREETAREMAPAIERMKELASKGGLQGRSE
ncbi:MAG: 4-hydroxy-tetrahydrodipicolinate synthase [Candidatus Eisenbacteria bacterium]|nr:4-hydroxy-tetrahydrodipicolinate synthase [Candidatus Eisenbacteria bacterium]